MSISTAWRATCDRFGFHTPPRSITIDSIEVNLEEFVGRLHRLGWQVTLSTPIVVLCPECADRERKR